MHEPQRILKSLSFSDISMDSLHWLTRVKIITSLKLQSALHIHYTKDNGPQSGTSIVLENIYNPVFRIDDVDSIDIAAEKEINLIQLQLQEEGQKQAVYVQEKQKAWETFSKTQSHLSSPDMAERVRALKDFERVRAAYENLQKPNDNWPALNIRLNYLRSKLHIKKQQSINGFISYLEIQ